MVFFNQCPWDTKVCLVKLPKIWGYDKTGQLKAIVVGYFEALFIDKSL